MIILIYKTFQNTKILLLNFTMVLSTKLINNKVQFLLNVYQQ